MWYYKMATSTCTSDEPQVEVNIYLFTICHDKYMHLMLIWKKKMFILQKSEDEEETSSEESEEVIKPVYIGSCRKLKTCITLEFL